MAQVFIEFVGCWGHQVMDHAHLIQLSLESNVCCLCLMLGRTVYVVTRGMESNVFPFIFPFLPFFIPKLSFFSPFFREKMSFLSFFYSKKYPFFLC